MALKPEQHWDTAQQYVESLTHWAAYVLLAREFTRGMNVLEVGCGYGYGANYLSDSVSAITAIDINKEQITFCRDEYQKNNLVFFQANGLKLPFNDNSFDLVLSFQVIEHIEPRYVAEYLSEIRRVMKKGGKFLVSTPNARMRLLPFQKPWNPEHTKEYKDNELEKLLGHVFPETKVSGLCSTSAAILDLEFHGRRPSVFRGYIAPFFAAIFGRFLPTSTFAALKGLVRRITKHPDLSPSKYGLLPEEEFLKELSLSDFNIDQTNTRDCIDLYGDCNKAEI